MLNYHAWDMCSLVVTNSGMIECHDAEAIFGEDGNVQMRHSGAVTSLPLVGIKVCGVGL
jgi:hypothetical protein